MVLQGSISSIEAPSKAQVQEPKGFNSNQNAKKLENLWEMEQYFNVAWIPKMEMDIITMMYVTSDVKWWWWTKAEDNEESKRPQIAT